MKRLYLLLILLLAVIPATATSYYVTQSGSGGNCVSAPIGSPMSVATFNGCSSGPTGGDTVFFTGTITSQVNLPRSGTGNGASRLTYDFTGATLNNTADPELNINAQNYVTVTGGTFAPQSGGDMIACNSTATHDITIQNWTYTGNAAAQTLFFHPMNCSFVLLKNNTVDNVASFINAYDNLTPHDYTILNNYARTSVNTTIQSDVVSIYQVTTVLIQGNELINRTPGDGPSGRHNDVIQFGSSSSAITIRYNWIEEAVTACGSTDGSNSWTMIEATSGTNYEYGNVFYTSSPCDFGNGATMDSNVSTVVWNVFNNSYVSTNSSVHPGIWFQNSGHLSFENNAFQETSAIGTQLIFDWTNTILDHNYMVGIGDCPLSGTVPVGTHGTCSATLPMFTNVATGELSPTSTLKNHGDSAIGSTYNQGICPGATWPNPSLCARSGGSWDVGAYQSSSTAPPAPTGLTATMH